MADINAMLDMAERIRTLFETDWYREEWSPDHFQRAHNHVLDLLDVIAALKAHAEPMPLVMPPDEWGMVAIWPLGKVGNGMEARIEVRPETPDHNREWRPIPCIRWGVAGDLVDVEFTRTWARAMLVAVEIAEQMQRPSAQDDEVTDAS